MLNGRVKFRIQNLEFRILWGLKGSFGKDAMENLII